ncbi:MAG: hypothetical protein J7K51_03990 [Thermotogae bacterium]|nr:hypothetical protein [Thermotogota bacterium]
MKICFTADQREGLESILSYHFGHCPYYIIVEVEGDRVKDVKSMPNPLVGEHNPGELPAFMREQGVDTIITGGMGPRAQQYFEDYGIRAVTGAYGRVRDVLEEFLHRRISVEESRLAGPGEVAVRETGESDEVERLKKENVDLRRQLADLKSRLTKIEEKLEK